MSAAPLPAWRTVSSLPRALGGPVARGILRAEPEDFEVDEVLGFEPTDEDEHWLLRVEKIGGNTEWAGRRLARHAGLPPRSVSYAGLKDRHAVTRQWFSVHSPRGGTDWASLDDPEIRILEVRGNRRKLQRGALTGNRFRLRVRAVQGDGDRIGERVASIHQRGVPNYFAEQRFGREDGNLRQAHALFCGQIGPTPRHLRGLYLSAARAQLFNEVLADRVERGDWDCCLPGDRLMLEGSRSNFLDTEIDEAIRRRCVEGDVHPTGPLWGAGDPLSAGAVTERETEVLAGFSAWREGLAAQGLSQERRALRVVPRELSYDLASESVLDLGFVLPAGSYATAVLREMLDYQD